MARIRTVKPDFWGSAKTAKVSRDARLLFLGLLNEADDEGRLLSSAKKIAGDLFPHDDDVEPNDVTVWLGELAAANFVQLYMDDGIGYCCVTGFGEHQRVSHPTPSKFPAPPERTSPDVLPTSSGEVPESDTKNSAPEVEQGTGNREQGNELVPPEPSAIIELPPGVSPPATTDPALRVFAAWIEAAGKTGRTVLTPERRRLILKQLKHYPLDDVVDAVRGWRWSAHHRGENDRGTVYNDLELVLRDAKHVEMFRDLERNPPAAPLPRGMQGIADWLQRAEAS